MKKIALLSAGLFCSVSLTMLFAENKPIKAYDSAAFNVENVGALKITRITPKGIDVPASNRQIVFKFNQPVVPVGNMHRDADEIPIRIRPMVNCQWLWLDTSSLSCQLNKQDSLKLATQYHIEVKPGIITHSGVSMKPDYQHRFTTQRPAIVRTDLQQWVSVGKPLIEIHFNQAVTQSSALKTIRFSVKDNKSIPISIDRASNPLTGSHYLQRQDNQEFEFIPATNINDLSDTEKKKVLDGLVAQAKDSIEARDVWIISPADDLPVDSRVILSIEQGLESVFGREQGIRNDRIHRFRSLPEFKFLGVSCDLPESYNNVIIPPQYSSKENLREKLNTQQLAESKHNINTIQQCNPRSRVALLFSSPVSVNEIKENLVLSPDIAGGRTDYDPWGNIYYESRVTNFLWRQYNDYYNEEYSISLPEYLQAYEQYGINSNLDFKDVFGRILNSPIDMSFLTAHRDPRLVLNHRHAVLEKNVDTDIPVFVTNLDRVTVPAYDQLTSTGLKRNQQHTTLIANAKDVSYPVRLGVREMLENKSGISAGFIGSSPELHYYSPREFRFFAQVTPYQVHFKLGHFNAIVWVTEMATGKPVAEAKVQLYLDSYPTLEAKPDSLNIVWTNQDGMALLPGIVDIDPTLNFVHQYQYEDKRFFLRVDKGNNMALLPLDHPYESGVNIWPELLEKDHHMHAWGTTAQGVYKAGDTVQYKLYVRNQSNRHWVQPESEGYGLNIIDPKGQIVDQIESLTLSEFGTYAGEFKVSKDAVVGWYRFGLTFKGEMTKQRGLTLYPMEVLISDFTPAPFRVTTELNGDQFQPGDKMAIVSLAKMHAGGPYADAQTRITANLKSRRFNSKHPLAKGFDFNSVSSHGDATVHQSSATVDKQGELLTDVVMDDHGLNYGRLTIESAVQDDRGKYVTGVAYADYIGRDRFIGLRDENWVHDAGKAASVEFLVVDQKGQPVSEVDVVVLIEHQVTNAARVKGAGNAYLTQYTNEWVKLSSCQQDSKGTSSTCDYFPQEPGSYRITATIKDTKDRESQSQMYTWVIGKGVTVWNQPNNDALQIVPNSDTYKIGDTAKFLVKNPYPGAEAMITVERYGVIRHWRQTLEGSTPIIELPIEPDDYPGVYLSVVVVSPRVAQPLGEGNVDLGKPAFKMGYVKVQVHDIQKEIDVSVTTDKQIYKPRDTVRAAVTAKARAGGKHPMELAVVVIDEAVFDLNRSGRNYYDPYNGFNHLDNLGVANYNLLMRLVGRQDFPKKGANPGGGGSEGNSNLRNLMKFVSYWNPSILLDDGGEAKFEFELPDNLTGWRIFAMAVTANDRMGVGDTNFKVNQPIELRPVMPNQLTEGDQFQAGFSVMNRTDKLKHISVTIQVAGSAVVTPLSKEVVVELAAYERKKVFLQVTTEKAGELAFLATARSGSDHDAVEHHVPVNKRRSLITVATYGTTTQNKVTEEVAFPKDIYKDVGGVSVVVVPSVLGNIAGAFRYMHNYPYYCWEQRLTKGVSAAQYNQLKDYMPDNLVWSGSKNLPQKTLDDAHSFQAPNGGMTYWINNDSYVSPYLSAYTALGFNWLRSHGYDVHEKVEVRLHEYLQNLLRRDDFPDNYSQGMHASIRAVALAALAKRGAIGKQDLARYRQHVPQMDLFGKAHYLQAAVEIGVSEKEVMDLSHDILSYSVHSGGKFQFNEIVDQGYQAILSTPMRSNCAILSSLLTVTQKTNAGLSVVGDVPFKQVRAITQTRDNRDHWGNTQENIFCINALIDYSRIYESEPPNMQVTANFHNVNNKIKVGERSPEQLIGSAEFDDLRDEPITLSNEKLAVIPGMQGRVSLEKTGSGRVYYGVRMQYAKKEDNAERINAGIEIRREYSVQREQNWHIIESPFQLQRGELVRVDIFVAVPTSRHFVVIDDPVPGGLEPVNRDLATASQVDADEAKYTAAETSWWYNHKDWIGYGRYGSSFYHKELRHDSARFYSDYLPAGNYHLSYVVQTIADGSFSVMPIKAKEMYDPDVYGLGLPARLDVGAR